MIDLAKATHELDWNDLRFFLAVTRGRTLARASAALGVDQTTVGRRIASLESKLRVALFKRTPAGFELTAAGRRVLAAAERMEEAALDVASGAAVEDREATAVVRIATTDALSQAFIVPAIASLRQRHPHITVLLNTGWARVDLRKGDADLAVRMVRPSDPRLACRKLADFAKRLYASREYVARHGMPTTLDDHALIAYEEGERNATRQAFSNISTERGEVALRSNSHGVLVAAAVAGIGIVQLPSYIGDAEPGLVRVLPETELPYAVWLVVPQANRRIAAVRAVCDAIAAVFSGRAAPTRPLARAGRSPRTARQRR